MAFLQATREISLMDQAVAEIRAVMNSSQELTEVLTRKINSEDRGASAGSSNSFTDINPETSSPPQQSDEEIIVEELIADLEVATCARDLASATTILKAGMSMLSVIDRDKELLRQSGLNVVHLRNRLESALEESRLGQVAKLEADLNDVAISTADIRFSASYLAYLSGDCRAAGSLLACYTKKISGRRTLQRKASDAEDSLRLAGSLAQDSFLLISSAFYDISSVFGQSMQEVYALTTQWAMHEARLVARHVRQQILGRLNSAQDMADVARIVSLLLVSCLTIEQEHGLCLDSQVTPEIWGALENVTFAQMSRMAVERKIQAQEDCYRLLDNPTTSSRLDSLSHEIWPSASQLLDDIAVMVECLQPLTALAPSDTWSRLLGPGIFAVVTALARGCKAGLQKAIATRDLRIRPTSATIKTVSALIHQTAVQVKEIVCPLELSCVCDLFNLTDAHDMSSRLELTLMVSELSVIAPGPAQRAREIDPKQPGPSEETMKRELTSDLVTKPKQAEQKLKLESTPKVSSQASSRIVSPPVSLPPPPPEVPLVKHPLQDEKAPAQAPQSRAQAALARAAAARTAKKGEPTNAHVMPPLGTYEHAHPPLPPPSRKLLPATTANDTTRDEPKQPDSNLPPPAATEGESVSPNVSKPPHESRAKAALERAMAARKRLQPQEDTPPPPSQSVKRATAIDDEDLL